MRAFSFGLLFVVFFFALASALPVGEESEVDDANIAEAQAAYQGADPGTRFRRVTCDLMSFGGKVNHSACAAHCLAQFWHGYRGGFCQNGVCHCRK